MSKDRKFSVLPTEEKTVHIVEWLKEKKGKDILALDISSYQTLVENVCIVTATSAKHAQGLADFVLGQCKTHRFETLHVEGHQAAVWILLDLNDIVVHIFQEDVRHLFRLQDLWPKSRIIAHVAEEV